MRGSQVECARRHPATAILRSCCRTGFPAAPGFAVRRCAEPPSVFQFPGGALLAPEEISAASGCARLPPAREAPGAQGLSEWTTQITRLKPRRNGSRRRARYRDILGRPELLAQAPHVRVHGACVHEVVVLPDVAKQ